MKIKSVKILLSLILALIIISCSTSSDVANNRLIQKRKYNKGFYHSLKNKSFDFSNDNNLAEVQEEKGNKQTVQKLQFEEQVALDPVIEVKSSKIIQEPNIEVVSLSVEKNSSVRKNLFSNLKKKTVYLREIKKVKTKISKKEKKGGDGDLRLLLFILCFFAPPIAVGIATDWDLGKVVVNILFCLLCGIPGIIHALIVVNRNA